jgi:5-methylcytosine-specific restriction endonuclease McrA
MKHKVTNVNEDELTGDCAVCGVGVRVKKSYQKRENQKQHYRCYRKYLVTKISIERPWDFHRKDYCERCGFLPEHDCQLTVDHIDGNKNNNEVSNYRTLCANCHNLKSFQNKDHLNRYS